MGLFDYFLLDVHRKLNQLLDQQAEIIDQNNHIIHQNEVLTMANQQITEALAKLNTATNDEAAQLDAVQHTLTQLKAQIANGVTTTDAAEIAGQIDAVATKIAAASDRLKQMAADPDNPVPPPSQLRGTVIWGTGQGPAPNVIVPNVHGMTLADATDLMEGMGVNITATGNTSSGHAVSQNPVAGSTVKFGDYDTVNFA